MDAYFYPRITISANCAQVITIKRTWKERFFSLPWRPWIKTKVTIEPRIIVARDEIICHPALLSQLQEAIRQDSEALVNNFGSKA